MYLRLVFFLSLILTLVGCGAGSSSGDSDSINSNTSLLASRNGFVTFLKDTTDSFIVNYPKLYSRGIVQAGNYIAILDYNTLNRETKIIDQNTFDIISTIAFNPVSYTLFDGLYKYENDTNTGCNLLISK
ncbi:hypothetical protein [Nitrosophilus labii]|uniref:hypothetical protein n=1 Tax=Nitrosophilus labii TaxID=2706014 RepID=UPI001656EACF|nr:hypothetical protein [Nitrosophilus labii]